MTEPEGPVPQLTSRTRAVDPVTSLLPLLDAKAPLVFIRRGEGVAGIGEALRLEFRGPDRIAQAADHVVALLEGSRSTWQVWHVRAEAERQVRTIEPPAEQTSALVALIVDEVLDQRSIALAAPVDGIQEPAELRRADGSSVYTVAGADRYTSQRIVDAEQRLITAAGQHDGIVVDASAVDLALLELAANGAANP